jgi:DNA-binding beta-propeller fold protein YncE
MLVSAPNATADFGFLTSHGTLGSGDGQFVDAHGLAVDAGGNLYVADGGNSRIQVLDASGAFVRRWGSYGTADGQFVRLIDVAVGGSGNVYAAEGLWGGQGRNMVQKFDAAGTLLTKWGGQEQFNGITGIAVDSADNVYVADGGGDQVKKFDSQGNLLTQWGSTGAAPGQFYFHKLSAIAVDTAGDVYTFEGNDGPDASPRRVQKFDPAGNPKNDFVDAGGNPTNSFTATSGGGALDVDAAGNFYVAGGGSLTRFTPAGAPSGSVSDCQTIMRGVTAHPNGMIYAGASTGVFVFGEGGRPCRETAPARLMFEGDEGVTINGGAQYTNDALVALTVEPAINTTELRVSNDGGFQSAVTMPVSATRLYAWTLDSSGPERLPKTVYVRFANEAESSSQNFTDDIILDQTAPKVSSAAVAETGTAGGAVVSARRRAFRLRVAARDNASGVARLQLAVRRARPGRVRVFRKRFTIRAKRAPRYVRVFDGAGNRSRWRAVRRP